MEGVNWPFLGRDHEVRLILHAIEDTRRSGMVLSGPPGVGKSRLAREVVRVAAAAGGSSVWINGAVGTEAVPFGPFADYIERDAAAGPVDSLRSIIRGLLSCRTGGRRLVVAVDDTQSLDQGSMAVLRHLVDRSELFVLAVTRPPDLLDAVLGANDLAFMELEPLTRSQAGELMTEAFASNLAASTAEQLWRVSAGNLRILNVLVLHGLDRRSLIDDGGTWHWRGAVRLPASEAARLMDQLFRLDADERSALEVLALGGALEASFLEALTAEAAVTSLELKGLVELRNDRRRTRVRLSGVLSGELVRQSVRPLRTRAVLRALADILEGAGGRRREDDCRLAKWRIDAGVVPPLELLLRGARRAAELFDPALTEKLARAAVDAGGGWTSRYLLASAMFDKGRGSEAEELLAELDAEASTGDERVLVAATRAQNLFFRLAQPEQAKCILGAAEQAAASDGARQRIAALRCSLLVWSSPVDQLLRAVEKPSPARSREGQLPWRRSFGALALAYSGQPEQALTDLTTMDGYETSLPRRWARWWALWLSGRLREAHALAEALYETADEEAARPFPAASPLFLGYSLLLRGRPATACRYLLEAASAGTDRGGFRHDSLTMLATAHALRGEPGHAQSAVAKALDLHHAPFHTHQYSMSLAQCWLAAARGDAGAARQAAMDAAAAAAILGRQSFEAIALHDVARLGGALHVTARLEDLATEVDGQLVPVLAAHSRALTTADARSLNVVAREFDAMGASIWAAEAAAEAARIYHTEHRESEAYTCRVFGVALNREAAATPMLAQLDGETDPLTAREREVARLAGHGLTSPQIAHQLTVAQRTVDNHLYRAYAKLGIDGRTELRSLHAAATTADERGQTTSPLPPGQEPE